MASERHFTTRHVADMCGVNLNSIQNWARRDLIRGFRTAGGHLRFRESDLLEFLGRQGIPLPPELARSRPRVFCLCTDCAPARAMGRWLSRDFECTAFADPWEMAIAMGEDAPDLMIVDLGEGRNGTESLRMLEAVATNPRTAQIPAIVLTGSQRLRSGRVNGSVREQLRRAEMKPAVLRKHAAQLVGR